MSGQALRSFSRGVMGAGKIALAGGAVIAGGLAVAIKAASDMQETMNKFNVVFADNSTAVKKWSDDFATRIGRSKKQIADFMAGSQDLFVPLGFEAGAATELSKQITGLAVDLASFNNTADADALRDLHAALTGSGEVMKKYGVIVSEAAVKQELLNQKIDPKTATEQQKVQARLNLIMRGTTAAQGDAERSSGAFANQVKALKGQISDAAVAIGSAFLPMATKMIAKVREVVTKVSGAMQPLLDALAAERWSLAGTIAIKGLQVGLLKGLVAIVDSVSGTFADLFGSIGTDIIQGDFVSAWETGLASVAAMWDGFVEGITAVFTQAMRFVIDQWESTVNGISSILLTAAANGNPFAQAIVGDGFLSQSSASRGDELSEEQRAILQGRRSNLQAYLTTLDTDGGDVSGVTRGRFETRDQLEAAIADLDKSLGQPIVSTLDQMIADAESFTGGNTAAGRFRSQLDDIDRNAQGRTRASRDALRGGSQAARDALAFAELELAMATDDASRAAARAKAKAAQAAMDGGGADSGGLAGRVVGSFSAAALAAQGGSSPMQELVKEFRMQRNEQRKAELEARKELVAQNAKLERIDRSLKAWGIVQ